MNELFLQMIETVLTRQSQPDEQEFLSHINTVVKQKMVSDGSTDLEGRDCCFIIRPKLRDFMWVHAVDAIEWALMYAVGEMEFDQAKEIEIPLLCRYYNDYLKPAVWTPL